MPIFKTPYRWLPSTINRNISHAVYDIRHGIVNSFRWIPVIWFDHDYDWGFLNTILIYKLERMAKTMENGHLMNCERRARQLRICATLCRRLRDEPYYDIAEMRHPGKGKFWAKMVADLGKQDQTLLGKMIGKYYTHWWD